MGKPGFFRQGKKRTIPAFCLLAIVLISMAYTPLMGEAPPTTAPTAPQAPPPVVGEATESDQAPPPKAPAEPAPSESVLAAKKAQENLTKEVFSYYTEGMLDPFIPFIVPASVAPGRPPAFEIGEEVETALEPEMQRPLTPLQKMSIGEIEKGLKAITWGELGRRALIEDSAGKGYIVSIGSPAGDKNGVVAQIFNDHVVIQQEVWDKDSKRMVPQNSVIKLWKETEQEKKK